MSFDLALFHFINGQWHADWLDPVLIFWRNRLVWTPLYALLAVWMVWRYHKRGVLMLCIAAVTVIAADKTNSSVIKPAIHRLRPCNDPNVAPISRLLVHCGKGYSFPSSHAVNSFSLAVFLALVFGFRHRALRWLSAGALFWAMIMIWAQVYVGVHYPFDVAVGAAEGAMFGTLGYIVYQQLSRRYLRKA